MDAFGASRAEARNLHHRASTSAEGALDATTLVEVAVRCLNLEQYPVAPDDPSLKGALALFDPRWGMIVYSRDASSQARLLHIAHELGHVCLDCGDSACTAQDIHPDYFTDEPPLGMDKVEDYGVRERRELRANVFAREFLLPRNVARRLYLTEGLTASEIRTRLGLPLNLVRQQLFDSLLLPTAPDSRVEQPSDGPTDPFQEAAVRHRGAPFQLQAGPGTGKTRTLVSRVSSLLDEDVEPSTILVLTYSNRAAAELSQRIERAAGERSMNVWIGTIHSFGLDLVRRYHDQLGLPKDPRLLDKGWAIAALEEVLPTLNLRYYRNLWDPTFELRPILNAISRAKDELVDPAGYRSLAQQMLERAGRLPPEDGGLEAQEAAEKALEVALVYERYEECLRDAGAVDFGDLICRPTRLLQRAADIQHAVRQRHRHVLVDEYQDVNRATVEFLKTVVGAGTNLWAVGDSRQSIYRFRGASAVNMAAFRDDFPGARVEQLETNYRSSSEIVRTLETFAGTMAASAGVLQLRLDAKRGSAGDRPEIRPCFDPEEERRAVAAGILELVKQGVPLSKQAVLCRSNNRLAEIAACLERHGIPALHLGNLFERPEIRDLLSILTVLVDRWRTGLVRVGAMDRYRIPLRDAAEVVDHLRHRDADGPNLCDLAALPSLSPDGKSGLARLAEDLGGLGERNTPWDVLATYLLERSDWLRVLAPSESVPDRMRCIAIWQLVNFARSSSQGGALPPIIQMLDRIRRVVWHAEDRDLRHVPDEALSMDAVRLMTLHGSKGLEFEAVHIPGVVVTGIPLSPRGNACPPPQGLVAPPPTDVPQLAKTSEHVQEEECLFFVGLSRARTHLRLYHHTQMEGGKKRNPSPYLAILRETVSRRPRSSVVPTLDAETTRAATSVSLGPGFEITDRAVRRFQRCPRQFLYADVLRLGFSRKHTPAELTFGVVRKVIDWFRAQRIHRDPTIAETEAYATEVWEEDGLADHGLAHAYRRLVTMVIEALHRASVRRKHISVEKVAVSFRSGTVVVTPDDMTELPDGRRVWRRTERKRWSPNAAKDLTYALYRMATESLTPPAKVEFFSLTDGEARQVEVSDRTLEIAKEDVDHILEAVQRGEFPAEPGERCPRCAHYFVCGALAPGEFVRP